MVEAAAARPPRYRIPEPLLLELRELLLHRIIRTAGCVQEIFHTEPCNAELEADVKACVPPEEGRPQAGVTRQGAPERQNVRHTGKEYHTVIHATGVGERIDGVELAAKVQQRAAEVGELACITVLMLEELAGPRFMEKGGRKKDRCFRNRHRREVDGVLCEVSVDRRRQRSSRSALLAP